VQQAEHGFASQSLDFLFRLLETPSVSGYEEPGQRCVAEHIRALGLEPRSDVHGNVWAAIGPDDAAAVGFEGHIDQVGLVVRHITDEGYMHCDFSGGSWEIYSRRVTVHTAGGPVPGVIGKQPLHYAESREGTKKIHEYWVDIGARDGEDARAKVALGDPITYDGPPVMLGPDLLMSCGVDNRIGVFCALEALRLLNDEGYDGPARVIALSCVQKETSGVGASAVGHALPLRAAIAVDVWPFVTDVPECDARRFGALKLGDGPSIVRGGAIAPSIFSLLSTVAKEGEIPHQVQAWTGPTPTDASGLYRSREGIPCGLLGVPERYLHTPSEVVHLGDVWNVVRLLAGFARNTPADADFGRGRSILSG